MKRPKVLISAYACEPGHGSEAGIGWNWVEQAARFCDVWVITRESNRREIEARLKQQALPGVHWTYYDLPGWARWWKRGARGVQLYYPLWQIGAYYLAKRLQNAVGFDFTHHVTFGSYWRLSLMGHLPVPFVWGPVGGGESGPKAFYRTFSLRGRIHEVCRDLVRELSHSAPFIKATARRARLALATTNETAAQLRRLRAPHVSVLSHVALPSAERVELERIPVRYEAPFRIVSIGRLVHWKGFHLGIEAFAELRRQHPTSEYWIIGEGAERKRLERLAQTLGAGDSVNFVGGLPRREVMNRLRQCDVLLHPSFHDSGGYVCAEAMAAGRPVICLDLGGPTLLVTEETGIRVPAVEPRQTVREVALALQRLARDPELRFRMAEAGRARVRNECNWDRKGELLLQIYGIAQPMHDVDRTGHALSKV